METALVTKKITNTCPTLLSFIETSRSPPLSPPLAPFLVLPHPWWCKSVPQAKLLCCCLICLCAETVTRAFTSSSHGNNLLEQVPGVMLVAPHAVLQLFPRYCLLAGLGVLLREWVLMPRHGLFLFWVSNFYLEGSLMPITILRREPSCRSGKHSFCSTNI